MNFPWAIRLARADAATLGPLRLLPGCEAGEDGGSVWVRGPAGDAALDVRLAALPADDRFEWRPPARLRRLPDHIPAHTLPPIAWHPLAVWLAVAWPAAADPPSGAPSGRATLRLVRGGDEQAPELLRARWSDWVTFAAGAAQVRLAPLQFAVTAAGEVCVRGRPLPPVPGERFVLHGRVAVPTGWRWEPAVPPAVLAAKFGLGPDALALWSTDGGVRRFTGEEWVAAARSAVRATTAALAGGAGNPADGPL